MELGWYYLVLNPLSDALPAEDVVAVCAHGVLKRHETDNALLRETESVLGQY